MKYVAISIMCVCHYLAQVVIVLGIWRTSAPDIIKIIISLLALLNSISFNTEAVNPRSFSSGERQYRKG